MSGTPTAAGAFSYAIKATDSGSPPQIATAASSGTIAPATLTLTATPSATTQVGQSYSQTNVASGGTKPFAYSLSSGALPAGTSLNTDRHGLGNADHRRRLQLRIKATDSGSPQQTATAASSGTITVPLVLTATPSVTTQVGQSYSQTNVASGGTTPYTYSLSGGALPAGTEPQQLDRHSVGNADRGRRLQLHHQVTDSGSPQQTATATTNVTIAPTPHFDPIEVPNSATRAIAISPDGSTVAGADTSSGIVWQVGGSAPFDPCAGILGAGVDAIQLQAPFLSRAACRSSAPNSLAARNFAIINPLQPQQIPCPQQRRSVCDRPHLGERLYRPQC